MVIGSGATAMTLVPAMASTAAHVTMLQRSPTYVAAGPDVDVIANGLRKVLPDKLAYEITRKKNTALQQVHLQADAEEPGQGQGLPGRRRSREALGPDYDVDTHFTPTYDPWDQRLCLVPNGDLFDAINNGSASVVTDHIDTFTETGIGSSPAQHLDADIIVTATGLNMVTLGEVDFVVDGEPVDFSADRRVQGLRLLRRAEPGVDVRLRQRVVDAPRRPDRPLRVPVAEPHGGNRHRDLHAAVCGPPTRRWSSVRCSTT